MLEAAACQRANPLRQCLETLDYDGKDQRTSGKRLIFVFQSNLF